MRKWYGFVCSLLSTTMHRGHVTVTHTVPEAANHIEDEDGNDEHASSITEWPLNRERNK